MLLKNKIKTFIKNKFKQECLVTNKDSLVFNYGDNKYCIYQNSLFNYQIAVNDSSAIFSGTYFQLIGFLEGIVFQKPEALKLNNPQPMVLKISQVLNQAIQEDAITSKYKKEVQDLNKKVKSLQDKNSELNKNYQSVYTSNGVYKKDIQTLNNTLCKKNKELNEKNSEIEQLTKDCEEAALLISDLYYKRSEITFGTKRYKLENFTQDAQLFIKDLIKEYYN